MSPTPFLDQKLPTLRSSSTALPLETSARKPYGCIYSLHPGCHTLGNTRLRLPCIGFFITETPSTGVSSVAGWSRVTRRTTCPHLSGYTGCWLEVLSATAGTHFSAPKFLRNVSTSTIWSSLVYCWAAIYTGLPSRIRVDAGKNFADRFIDIAKASDIKVDPSSIESHSSLGIDETYQQPLRNTFRKLKLDFPTAGDTTLLAMSVKAMIDTLGPEGCVPSTLVFGVYPSLNIFGKGMKPKFGRKLLKQPANKWNEKWQRCD